MVIISEMANAGAPPERKLSMQQKVSALYLASMWLTSQLTVPFADFERIPCYVALTVFMYFFLPARAMLNALLLLLILGMYELLKSSQLDFAYTTKGVLGIIGFSCVMSATFSSLKLLQDCSARQLGYWLWAVLLTMAGAVALEIGLTLMDLTQQSYQNYLFPIPAFTGLFTEPSHFALALCPFLFLVVKDFAAFRRYVGTSSVAVLAVLIVLCPSATIVAIIALAACVSFSASAIRMKLGGLTAVILLGSAVSFAIISVP